MASEGGEDQNGQVMKVFQRGRNEPVPNIAARQDEDQKLMEFSKSGGHW